MAARLTLLPGGPPATVTVLAEDLAELRLEALQARKDRLVTAQRARQEARAAMRYLRLGRLAAVGMALVELSRLAEQEASRAVAMDVPVVASVPDERPALEVVA